MQKSAPESSLHVDMDNRVQPPKNVQYSMTTSMRAVRESVPSKLPTMTGLFMKVACKRTEVEEPQPDRTLKEGEAVNLP